MSYELISLGELVAEASESVRPPIRMPVWKAAEEYTRLNNPGSYVGPYDADKTPYMKEPMEVLTSVSYTAMIFVASAQCGKTQMFPNWVAYTTICDPADMMLLQTTQATSRDFSKRRIQDGRSALFRNAPLVKDKIVEHRNAKNTYDVSFKAGTMLNFSWPTVNELSGKPIPRLFLTDYDRMPQDIDGEGSPFKLAKARATTFQRLGMTVVETTPGFDINNAQWAKPKGSHEAPPCEGALSLYNTGDRRRWYWKCTGCEEAFEPTYELLQYPDEGTNGERARQTVMGCPHCGTVYEHSQKFKMNKLYEDGGRAKWIKEGQRWNADGTVTGTPRETDTASFWLMGVVAAFNTWTVLVEGKLDGEDIFNNTGDETDLKAHVNTKIGMPYKPKALASLRLAENIKETARNYGNRVVPFGVRFLVATVDVQARKFVVQIHGVNADGDIYVVDRYDVRHSRREDEERPGQVHLIDPGAYKEDWRILLDEVMLRTYPLADESGVMGVKMTFCDSAGSKGFTANAYEFYRWLRRGWTDDVDLEARKTYPHTPNMAARFQLVKGLSNAEAQRVKIAYPDAQRKDRHSGARGDVPVLLLNSNSLKNMLDNRLNRLTSGGMIRFPDWLPLAFYKELTVEVKNEKGQWENPNSQRNESWDLLYYCIAGCLHHYINIEHLDFANPPSWAAEWQTNDLVILHGSDRKLFDEEEDSDYDLEDLAKLLA